MKDKTFDVVVIGNVGIDTNVYPYGNTPLIDTNVESNFTENIDYVGQAGGYASLGYARLGQRTAFIGYVGDDFSGRFIRETLTQDGIDITALFIDPMGTSRSINFMDQDGRRKNFYDGKGHMHLRPDEVICTSVLSRTTLAHFNIPNWARDLLPIAKDLGVTIACDIQDVVTPDDDYRRDFIAYADILFFSAVNYNDPRPLMQAFLAVNPDLILISGMGDRGCALGTKTGVAYFPPVPMDAPVIDTNGAGDSLAVGFLSSYLLDDDTLRDAVLRGQIAARYMCAQKPTPTQNGASVDFITPEKLAHYFHKLRSFL